jgi:UDP-glucose 4-epimerase
MKMDNSIANNDVTRGGFPFGIVLVTGAAGFVGSRACAILRKLGVKVIAVDNLYVGLPLPKSDEMITSIEADIRDRETLRAIFKDHSPQAVLHLAAVHHIPTCEREPSLAFDTNIMGTQCLLEAIEASDCMGIVMASSGAVYDWSDGMLLEATSPLRACDVYATSKLTNEYQLETWTHRKDRRAHAGRLFNTIGTNDPNGHLIPDIITQLSKSSSGNCTIKLGNTKPKRDYIFVDDAAAGFVNILGGIPKGDAFETFNLSRGEEFSVAELVDLIGTLMGVDVTIEPDPSRFRKVDRLSQLGDPSKMEKRFGWRARYALRDALAKILSEAGYSVGKSVLETSGA